MSREGSAAQHANNRARRAAEQALIEEHQGEYECWYRFECLADGGQVRPVVQTPWVRDMTDTEVRAWGLARLEARLAELQGLRRAVVQAEVSELEAMLDTARRELEGEGDDPMAD